MINLRDNIQVVLVNTRFPENIGMAARACGNMGVKRLALVNPELWPKSNPCAAGDPGLEYLDKALAPATAAGKPVLEGHGIFPSLDAALARTTLSFGSTARTGGWRQEVINPGMAAELAFEHLKAGGTVSFVFGPEDKGLDNEDIEKCSHLVAIPTSSEPSLNLAQAVLLILYELSRTLPFEYLQKTGRTGRNKNSPFINHEQTELLMERVQSAMLALKTIPTDNSGYFMLPLRRMAARYQIRHNEYSILMGVCGKILRLTGEDGEKAE